MFRFVWRQSSGNGSSEEKGGGEWFRRAEWGMGAPARGTEWSGVTLAVLRRWAAASIGGARLWFRFVKGQSSGMPLQRKTGRREWSRRTDWGMGAYARNAEWSGVALAVRRKAAASISGVWSWFRFVEALVRGMALGLALRTRGILHFPPALRLLPASRPPKLLGQKFPAE